MVLLDNLMVVVLRLKRLLHDHVLLEHICRHQAYAYLHQLLNRSVHLERYDNLMEVALQLKLKQLPDHVLKELI